MTIWQFRFKQADEMENGKVKMSTHVSLLSAPNIKAAHDAAQGILRELFEGDTERYQLIEVKSTKFEQHYEIKEDDDDDDE